MDREAIFRQTLGDFLEPIQGLLDDAAVSEILINGHREVYVERRGRLERVDNRFPDAGALEAAVRNIAQYVGRSVTAERPVLDARLTDGSRVCVVSEPVARGGTCVAIRRFPRQRLTIDGMVASGTLSADCRDFLRAAVAGKCNVLISGGTGTGKTSLLNVLSSYIDPAHRVVVIEDSSEIQLQQPHVVYLETRPADARGRGEVTIRDLLRASLRLRPDRIVVGECRGAEALDLVQAMTSGHGGSLATIHANHPRDTLHRLETLCLMSDVKLPLTALRSQVASAIQLVVQIGRLNDGSRRVTDVFECLELGTDGGYRWNNLFSWRARRDAAGRVVGALEPSGNRPSFAGDLERQGLDLPAVMHRDIAGPVHSTHEA